MNKTILLFTFQFPFGFQETFLETEIEYLKFEKVYILPLFGNNLKRDTPENVSVLPPVFNTRVQSFKVFTSFFFWIVSFKVFLEEIRFKLSFIKKVFKQSIIIAGLKKYLSSRPELASLDIWYFYWGTNSVNVLPFLNEHPLTVARFHRFDLYDIDVDGGEVQVLRSKMLPCLKSILHITEDGKEYLKKKFPLHAQKMMISRLGVVDKGLSQPSSDNIFRILSCSNIYAVKRVHLIAKALQGLTDIPIKWTHFGDGPEKLKSLLQLEVNKLPDNVSFDFKGRVSNEEVMEFYKTNEVDLFVNVSVSEGLPVSIMEALSFGVPVMATKCGGIGELVTEKNGKPLSLYLSSEELCEEFRYFYKNSFKNSIMRSEARESWNRLVNADQNYQDFYQYIKELS